MNPISKKKCFDDRRDLLTSILSVRVAYPVLQHMKLSPLTSDAYWNYSIDELARFDTPTMINYVLKATG